MLTARATTITKIDGVEIYVEKLDDQIIRVDVEGRVFELGQLVKILDHHAVEDHSLGHIHQFRWPTRRGKQSDFIGALFRNKGDCWCRAYQLKIME